MWFEQFWSGVITIGFVAATCYVIYPMNKLDIGRKHRRNVATLDRQLLSARDHRLTGNMYKESGLKDMFPNEQPLRADK